MLDVTNSYVTLVEAEAYFASRLDVAAWVEATASQKEQALVTAAGSMESFDWVGVITNPDQPLAWPRVGSYFEPRFGYTTPLIGVPNRVKNAQLELAYHLLNNDGILDDTAAVKNVKVGPIEIEGIRAPSTVSSIASRTLRPLLRNSGVATVWRAN